MAWMRTGWRALRARKQLRVDTVACAQGRHHRSVSVVEGVGVDGRVKLLHVRRDAPLLHICCVLVCQQPAYGGMHYGWLLAAGWVPEALE